MNDQLQPIAFRTSIIKVRWSARMEIVFSQVGVEGLSDDFKISSCLPCSYRVKNVEPTARIQNTP